MTWRFNFDTELSKSEIQKLSADILGELYIYDDIKFDYFTTSASPSFSINNFISPIDLAISKVQIIFQPENKKLIVKFSMLRFFTIPLIFFFIGLIGGFEGFLLSLIIYSTYILLCGGLLFVLLWIKKPQIQSLINNSIKRKNITN